MEIKHFECVVDGHHGVYIPQIFAEQYPEWLDDEEREILLAGPEHEDYWDVWDEVTSREFEDQSLYLGESGDVFILTDSPLNAELQAWSSGEYLENCPKWLRKTVTKLAYEFITDRPDEIISEEEALEYFKPSQYDTYAESQAPQWMHVELTERMLWIRKDLFAK